jgi:DNA ligase-1
MKRAMRAGEAPDDLTKIKYPVLVSAKLDGIGCVIWGGVALSRKMKPIPNLFVQSVLKHLPDGMHGELIVGDARKDNAWNEAQSGVMSRDGRPAFCFNVFDWYRGAFDAFSEPTFSERHRHLRQWMMKNATDFYKYVPHFTCHNEEELRERAKKLMATVSPEGVMLRDPDGPYKQGRSTTREGYLLKVKPFKDAEATVIGFEEEMENTNAAKTAEDGRSKRSRHKAGMKPKGTLGALVAKSHVNGETFKVSGFRDDIADAIWHARNKYMGKTFTYAYLGLTVNGKPRHPTFKGWRHD